MQPTMGPNVDGWNNGVLVAICGIDGSGKSSLISELATALLKLGVPTALTEQPTQLYRRNESVRKYHDQGESDMWEEGLALLSACDRLLHVRNTVLPQLQSGKIVITHRYVLATYAIFRARGVDTTWLRDVNKYCPEPHLTVLLDCPAEVAVERIRTRGGYIRREERSVEALEAIRRSYREELGNGGYIVDATRHPESLLVEVLDVLKPHLERHMPA